MQIAAVQQALFDRLTAQVGGSYTGIYSDVPQDAQSENSAAFPFVTIGPFTPSPWSTDDNQGITVLTDVGVWTRDQSSLDRRVLTDGIYSALDRHQLAITGANTVDCLFENMVEVEDPDGITTHSVLTFRITYDSI